jgi:hypothetical protein
VGFHPYLWLVTFQCLEAVPPFRLLLPRLRLVYVFRKAEWALDRAVCLWEAYLDVTALAAVLGDWWGR